jgi:N-acetylmuramoyl-L-alanine amidase
MSPALRSVSTVVLSAGHGGADPGACHGQHNERDQCIQIVDWMAARLQGHGIMVDVVPHQLGLGEGIRYVNARYPAGKAWALEIHRDSANGLNEADASTRCGIYYGVTPASHAIAKDLLTSLLASGAHPRSWVRPDTQSRHQKLAWIRQPHCMSHLLELAFMQGDNTERHLKRLAAWAADAVRAALQ